jgi:hypothetical protein
MASSYSPLKIELIGTGDQNGTWGATTNINFNTALQEAITGTVNVAFTSADVTLTLSNTNGSLTARNLRLNLTGTSGGARNLFIPATATPDAFTFVKFYIVNNNLADTVTVAVVGTPGTTTAVPAGASLFVYTDGTNVTPAINYFSGTFGPITTSSITDTGNLTFTGTGNRIRGDFSNATITNRVAVQSSTTDGNTSFAALPNGTSVTSNIRAYGNADPTNASFVSIQTDAGGTALISSRTGSGTYQALSIQTGGAVVAQYDTSGNYSLSIAGASFQGDFSNATVASRNAFKTSTTNGNTVVGALPNGTGTGSAWQAYNAADPSNAGLATLEVSSTAVTLGSSIRGSGTYLPMVFSTNGSTQMTLSTAGNLGLGNTPSGSFKLEVTGKVYSSGGYNVRVSSATSASTLTPNIDNFDMYAYTALAAGITISTPTGTPANGQKLMFRFKDNGTAQTISWSGLWPTQIGVTLPTTTVANKITYVGMIYNGGTSGWDAVAVTTQA